MNEALFLHGAGAWGGQWAIWQRVFEAEGWRTSAPDRQPPAAGLAAARFEDHVAQSVEAFDGLARHPENDAGIGDAVGVATHAPVLIGASLGGLLALAVAARRAFGPPGAAPRALVLVNPVPPAPWAAELPPVAIEGDVVPWHSQGRYASTMRSLPNASFTDRQYAFRRWRDESAALLREVYAGVHLPAPSMPVLVIASDSDMDIPPDRSTAFAQGIGASLVRVPGGHVDPVMGASAADSARSALQWIAAAAPTRLAGP